MNVVCLCGVWCACVVYVVCLCGVWVVRVLCMSCAWCVCVEHGLCVCCVSSVCVFVWSGLCVLCMNVSIYSHFCSYSLAYTLIGKRARDSLLSVPAASARDRRAAFA